LCFPLVEYRRAIATTSLAYRPPAFCSGQLAASGTFIPRSQLCLHNVADPGNYKLGLPAAPVGGAAYGHADCQRLKIMKAGHTGTLVFARGAIPAIKVPANRSLANDSDWIE